MIRTRTALVLALLVTLLLTPAAPRAGLAQDGDGGTAEARDAIREAAARGRPATPDAATPNATPESPAGSATVGGTAVDLLPEGDDGGVDVVLWGGYAGAVLHAVVRNTTDAPVESVSVFATARDPSGAVIVEGGSAPSAPDVVEPGGYALVSILFLDLITAGVEAEDLELPDGVVFEFEVTARDLTDQAGDALDLEIAEAEDRGDHIDVLLVNPHDDPVSYPIYYELACLGEDGALLAGGEGQADVFEIPPGGTARVEVPVLGGPLFVVAANGAST